MKSKTRAPAFRRLVCWSLVALPFSACGGGGGDVSGVYLPEGQAIWDKFDFQSGQKVAVSFMGQTAVGEYTVMDDGRVRVMLGGDVITLKKTDGGCLEVAAGDEAEAKTARELEMNPAELGRFCPD